MGSCTSRLKKRKGDSLQGDNKKTCEDVTYASINHTSAQASRKAKAAADTDDCDYAIVKMPTRLEPEVESDSSSKEECADDYVLMG